MSEISWAKPSIIRKIEDLLGDQKICDCCGATLATYADACTADLADPCPGFVTVERARAKAEKMNTP